MNQSEVNNRAFKFFLENELERRQAKNSSYSLRSFAKFLEIDAPTLSKILNGKKVIGEKLITRLSEKLGSTPNSFLCKECSSEEDFSFHLLTKDQAQYLSHWYYYAILEVIELDDFQYDYKWISKRLNIPYKQAQTAIERMIRLGLIEKRNGCLIDKTSGKTTNISSELSSSSRREHQKEILELAIDALENTSPYIRDQSSMTVSINTDDIPKTKALIKQFRRDMSKFLNNSKNKDQVYNLGISFYPVTKGIFNE